MKSLIAMAATAAMALCALPAAAQPGKGSKAPLDVAGDQAVYHNSDCVSVWTGSTEALQDTSRLRADTMIVHMEVTKGKPGGSTSAQSTNGCGATTSVEAKGHVYYLAADGRRVHGDNAFYDLSASTITITGDVTAVDGQNVMRGSRMVYNTQTGEGHVEGGGSGPNGKNRPRGVFYPKNADEPADAAPDAGPKKKKAAK